VWSASDLLDEYEDWPYLACPCQRSLISVADSKSSIPDNAAELDRADRRLVTCQDHSLAAWGSSLVPPALIP